ncbi:hypothetical protein [Olsenella phocaeensis]|uniref:hypothetical protein n=1 Tax=Olsenella phocaeensis TaxID=1852385 RepID=UPI001F3A54A9|nr:hypothetical protein [Olsenella phocaeensis]
MSPLSGMSFFSIVVLRAQSRLTWLKGKDEKQSIAWFAAPMIISTPTAIETKLPIFRLPWPG